MKKPKLLENRYKFLNELSDFKNFEDRIKYAKKHLEKIGKGSSRIVFALGDKNVLKLAINDAGIAQNKEEIKPNMQTEITNNVVIADPSGKWLIQKKLGKISLSKFKTMTGFNFGDFFDAVYYKFNNEDMGTFPKPINYNQIVKSKLFLEVCGLILENDLLVGDLEEIDSWGIDLEDEYHKLKIVDYGLTKDNYEVYYSDNATYDS